MSSSITQLSHSDSASISTNFQNFSYKAKKVALTIAALGFIIIGLAGIVAFIGTMSNVGVLGSPLGTCITVCCFTPALLIALHGINLLGQLNNATWSRSLAESKKEALQKILTYS